MTKKQKGFTLVEGLLILTIASLIGFTGWYAWHSKNNAYKALAAADKASNFQTKTKKATIKNASASEATGTTGTEETTGNNVNASKPTPSTLTIDDVKIVPVSDHNPYPQSYPNYLQVNFTLTNNSSNSLIYKLGLGGINSIYGITSTGEVKYPLCNVPMNCWTGTTITAGGSAKGYALFIPSDNITTLEWIAPDSSSPVDFPIKSP